MLTTNPSGPRRRADVRRAMQASVVVAVASLLLGVGQIPPAKAVENASPEPSPIVVVDQGASATAAPVDAGQSSADPTSTSSADPTPTATVEPEPTDAATPPATASATPDATDTATPEPTPAFEEITAEEQQLGITPMSVPAVPAGHVVISVRIGGDRAADTGGQIANMNNAQATGVAGVTLYLGKPGSKVADSPSGQVTTNQFTPFGNAGVPYGWATCVSDAQGDCNFIVPIVANAAQGADSTGMVYNRKPWVGMATTAHPAITSPGWHMPYTSVFANNVNVSQALVNSSFTYLFQFNKDVTSGSTYLSTDNTFAFLKDGNGDATNFTPDQPSANQPGTIVSGGRYMVVRDNPGLKYTPDCAIKMAIVLDLSNSMQPADMIQAKAAMDGLVNNLTGKSTTLGLFSFNSRSPAMLDTGLRAVNAPGPYAITTPAQATAFKNRYSAWQPPLAQVTEGATNWDHALTTVANSGVTYDVVVFITDGAATTLTANPYSLWGKLPSGGGYIANTRSLEAGVFSANLVKSKGTRIVPFYVDNPAPSTAAGVFSMLNNVRNISGPTQGTDFFNSNFSNLATYINSFAQTCANTTYVANVNVNKVVQDVNGLNPQPAANWTLGASATATAGTVTQSPVATTQVTPASGGVSWALALGGATSRASVAVSETQKPGYEFVSGTCTIKDAAGVVRQTVTLSSEAGATLTGIAPQETVDCTFVNKPIKPATINVTKRIQDADGTNERPAADWTLGAVTTASTGTVTPSPAATTQTTTLPSGTVSWTAAFTTSDARASVAVSETMKPDWVFVSGACVVTPVTGSPRTITLSGATGNPAVTNVAPGETVNCTFVNKPDVPVTGSVSWEKVNGTQHLAGSAWNITGPSPATTVLAVDDCTSAPCAGPDTDQRAGYLKVSGLAVGGYTLVETKAPAGYILDTTPRPFTIGSTAPAKLEWDLGAIENKQQLVPSIPLTGGIGRDHLIVAGSGFLAAAVLLGAAYRRRLVSVSRQGRRFPQG